MIPAIITILLTSCNINSENHIITEVLSIAQNYTKGNLNDTAKKVMDNGIMIIGDEQKMYIIDPGNIFTDRIDSDKEEDAIISLFPFQRNIQMTTEHLVIINISGKLTLLRNDGGNKNHWLGLTLKGKNGPASAIAAKVTVKAGGKKQVLINQWSTGYLSNNDPRLHIGLGKENKIDIMEIHWSDGEKEVYSNIPADKYITILQGKGILSGN